MSSHQTFNIARYVALGALTVLTFGVTAHAGEATAQSDEHSTVIRYSDLDLSRADGVRALYSRLQRAAGEVCGEYRDTRDLRMKRLYAACYQDSLARAVERVDHVAVTAMFAADHQFRVASHGAKSPASI